MKKETKAPLTDKLMITEVIFGCDPEFFFERKGHIIGAEKVIDIKKGLTGTTTGAYSPGHVLTKKSQFIVDGVQAELNPKPDTCRARLGNEISQCFKMLYNKMKEDKELSINFAPTVRISKKELLSLDEKSRMFGCSPSKNADKNSQNAVKTKDPAKYPYRSAGGHIHLGVYSGYNNPSALQAIMREPERLVQILDILVGNTCVLIDRDPGNKERRKTYGRAGEHRTPPHGLEYRTLSNFWLRAYPLMSLVMSLSRISVSIMTNSIPGRDYENELLNLINPKDIKKAINTNDFDLAWDNFQKIKPFIARVMIEGEKFPLSAGTLAAFEFFVSKGTDFWFQEDPIQHWIKLPDGHQCGWENFLKRTVMPQMMQENPTPAPLIK